MVYRYVYLFKPPHFIYICTQIYTADDEKPTSFTPLHFGLS